MFIGIHAAFKGLFALVAHIDLTGRVFADQDHGQTGGNAVIGFQLGYFGSDVFAQFGCEGFAVDDFCVTHLSVRPVSWDICTISSSGSPSISSFLLRSVSPETILIEDLGHLAAFAKSFISA